MWVQNRQHGPAAPATSRGTMTPSLPEAHNYHDWVFGSFAPFLRRGPTLEVGSGHGQYARRLLARPQGSADPLYISDLDPAALDTVRAELRGLPVKEAQVRYLVMNGIDPAQLDEPLANLLLINVLEHIEDDAGVLAAAHRALAPDGVLVVFAPAHERLYGRMDWEAGHHRRYELQALRRLLTQAGFHVAHARHFNAVGCFGWYANKLLGSGVHSAAADAQVRLYNRLVPLFKHADRLLPFLGQSVLAIGARPLLP